MPPERHDDVEDVVGRARGDVAPEETRELASLISLVERNAPRDADAPEVGKVFALTATSVGSTEGSEPWLEELSNFWAR